jgi:uncharacterized protein (TIGR04255 family)
MQNAYLAKINYGYDVMTETWFKNPPVVEIVAELRWPPQVDQNAVVPPSGPFIGNETELEDFYFQFRKRVFDQGYDLAERIVPNGFPSVYGQTVWRYKRSDGGGTLIQLGPGVFTVNALSPYKNWSEFLPVIQQSVQDLLSTRIASEQNTSFNGIQLIYLNAFRGALLNGKSAYDFVESELGVRTSLPEAFSGLLAKDGKPSSNLNLLIEVANQPKVLSINLGRGSFNGEEAVLLNLTVSHVGTLQAVQAELVDALSNSRSIIHQSFMSLTKSMHAIMQPSVGEA